jgi:hypothetical protein
VAALDRPLWRLEKVLEGLRLSALETARLYEARADVLGGRSGVDHIRSAKRWRDIADQAADLSAALRDSSRWAPRPAPAVPVAVVPVAVDVPPSRADDVPRPAGDAMDHLRAARVSIDVLLAAPGRPASPDLRIALRDLERAVQLLREIAVAEGPHP